MSSLGIADSSRRIMLQQDIFRMKSNLNILTTELASQKKSDPAVALNGQLRELSETVSDVVRSATLSTVLQRQKLQYSVAQNSFTAVRAATQFSMDELRRLTTEISNLQAPIISHGLNKSIDQVLSALNVSIAGEFVFSGRNNDVAPFGSGEELLSALTVVTAGVTDFDDLVASISEWFSDPSGFKQQFYFGGEARPPVKYADGLSVGFSLTADTSKIRSALCGLAIGVVGLSLPGTRPDVVAEVAAEFLQSSIDSSVELSALLGVEAKLIDQISISNEERTTSLTVRQSEILSVDAEANASKIEDVNFHLELLFVLAGRIHGLSLLSYLR